MTATLVSGSMLLAPSVINIINHAASTFAMPGKAASSNEHSTTSASTLDILRDSDSGKIIVLVPGVFGNPLTLWTNRTGVSWPGIKTPPFARSPLGMRYEVPQGPTKALYWTTLAFIIVVAFFVSAMAIQVLTGKIKPMAVNITAPLTKFNAKIEKHPPRSPATERIERELARQSSNSSRSPKNRSKRAKQAARRPAQRKILTRAVRNRRCRDRDQGRSVRRSKNS